MKNKTKLLFTFALLPLLLTGCDNNAKRPLDWCLWEIEQYEGFENGFGYTYQEVYTHNIELENNNDFYEFYITIFTDGFKSEWVCGVETKITPLKFIPANKIIYIDCDEVLRVNYCDYTDTELLK